MNKHRIILTLSILIHANIFVFSQDVHFTQYNSVPFYINPALTGWFDGSCMVTLNYRDQWREINNSPYATYGISAERQHYLYTKQINYGVAFLQDNSGESRLKTNIITLSGSYVKEYNGHKLLGGLQFNLINNSINADDNSFDSQFDLGEDNIFNTDIQSGENLSQSNFYLSINAGLLWSKRLTEKITPIAGFALYHINTPNESLYEIHSDDTDVAMRMVLHGSLDFMLTKKLTVIPSVLYMNQDKATDFLVGINAEFSPGASILKKIYGGAQFRYGMSDNFDAIAAIIGTKFHNIDLGVSYDFNISTLQTATNSKGAFEVAVKYLCRSTKVKKVKVSCERL